MLFRKIALIWQLIFCCKRWLWQNTVFFNGFYFHLMYINVQCASLNLKLVKANWCRAVWLILCWEILFGKKINWISGFFGALCKGSLRKIAKFCGFPSYSDVKIFYSVQSFIHKWLEPYFEEKTAEMFEKGSENCWKIVQIIY